MEQSNAFYFDHLRQIESLKEAVGSLEECKRLGFIYSDEHGVQSLSSAGLGFLLYVVSGHCKTMAEAFSMAWQLAKEETVPDKEI